LYITGAFTEVILRDTTRNGVTSKHERCTDVGRGRGSWWLTTHFTALSSYRRKKRRIVRTIPGTRQNVSGVEPDPSSRNFQVARLALGERGVERCAAAQTRAARTIRLCIGSNATTGQLVCMFMKQRQGGDEHGVCTGWLRTHSQIRRPKTWKHRGYPTNKRTAKHGFELSSHRARFALGSMSERLRRSRNVCRRGRGGGWGRF